MGAASQKPGPLGWDFYVGDCKMVDFNAIIEGLVACDTDKVTQLVNAAIAENVPATDILNKGLIAGMDIVGEKMENGDMFIPEVLMAAQAMGRCVETLKPLLGEGEEQEGASVIIGMMCGVAISAV